MTPLARRSLRLGLLLGAAHHPLCTRFRHDVVRVGRLHVCSGCLATWPALAVVLPLAFAARFAGAPALALLAAGLALGLPQMASYLWRGGRGGRFAAKAVGGAGLALVAVGLFSSGWPWPVLAAVLAGGAVAALALQAVRMRSILAACDACPYRRDWGSCPGFARIDAPVAQRRGDLPDLPLASIPPRPGRPVALVRWPGSG